MAQLPSFAVDDAAPGHGRVAVARVEDQAAIISCAATSPLKLICQRRGAAAWIYAASFGGGLMPGDDLALTIDVGPHARAFVTSQSATKVFRSDDGGEARSRIDARVGAAGLLALWPDPVACFADARFANRVRVDLAAHASALVVDAVTGGRLARGERWSFARYAARIELRRDGAPLAIEALTLDRADGDIGARLPGCGAYASALLVGPLLRDLAGEVLALVGARDPAERPYVSASPLADGCALRVAAESAEAVHAALRRHLAALAPLIGGDPWSHRH
ncbi:MAG TPA: urease accessory protein UreD [Planctomycetota bacterium]|nr:urease accessory protein UreD [Planctomycetota bacterium]